MIVTQDLCAVCAVSSGELASACPVGAEVISLDPQTFDDVAASIELLAGRLGAARRGSELAERMRATAEEVAHFYAFLCSPRASYCLGSSYYVDGGWLRTVE